MKPKKKTATRHDSSAKAIHDCALRVCYWVVMKSYPFSGIRANGHPVICDPADPQRFIPVFDTREQAVAWNNGSEDNVSMIRTVY